jgi:peptidoglycan/xylan/chitin deacetylase (PgdA/CDA1 family)
MIREMVSGLIYPVTRVLETMSPGIRILMYHRVRPVAAYDQLAVTPERFESQMRWLSQHHRVIGMDQALQELADGDNRSAVVVTFDDGYLGTLQYAWPIMKKYHIPATLFVTTNFCDGKAIHPRYQWDSGRVHLNWSEVKQLATEPGITIGSHTLSHPYLSRLDDVLARAEIVDSGRKITEQLGIPTEVFCYPSGDYGERELKYVREAGYRGAVTVSPGRNRDSVNLFALRRTEVNDRDSVRQLRCKLGGAYDPVHKLLDHRRRRRFRQLADAPGNQEIRN